MEIKRILIAIFLICAIGMPAYGASVGIQADFMAAGLEQDDAALSGGLIYTYEAGTTTAKTCWTDRAKTTAETNPVVLDAQGRSTTFCDGVYKMVIKDSSGTTLVTMDGVSYGGEGLSTTRLSSYSSLSEAVADIGVTNTVLLIDTTDTLDANVTVPSNITLVALERDAITLNGKTLAVNGDIWAGTFQWIVGTGTFSGSPGVQFYDPTWTASTVTDSATPSYTTITLNSALINGTTIINGSSIINTTGIINTPNMIAVNAPAAPVANRMYTESLIKAWGAWTGDTPPVKLNDYNVTGVTRSSLGIFVITWNTDFAVDNEYALVVTASNGSFITEANPSAATANIKFYDAAGNLADPSYFYFIAVGYQ